MKKNGIGRCVLLALMLIGGFIIDDDVLTNSFLRWLFAIVFTALFVWVALPLVRVWRQPRERKQ